MFTKFLAAAATVLIAAGVAIVAFAAPASAHHTDLIASAACTADGGWDVTWSVINSENADATVTASNNAAVPVDTILPPNPRYYSDNANSLRNTFVQHVMSNDPVNLTITAAWLTKTNAPTNTQNLTFSSFPAACGSTEAIPVQPAVRAVSECGTVGVVTAGPTTGVVYRTTFDETSGDYTVIATPASGYAFKGTQQTVTYTGNAGAYYDCVSEPKPVASVGECVYRADGTAADRDVTITFDNTQSNKAVLFQIAGLPQFDTTVPARQSVAVALPRAGAAGITYTVTADGKSFEVTVAPCPSYEKPQPRTRDESQQVYDCASDDATVSTTTYTTDYLFDTAKREWVAQPETASAPVISHRALTADEKAAECGVTVDTDPTASACNIPNTNATLDRWIRIVADPKVVYTATNTVTNVVTTLTDEYTDVDAGKYLVTAVAATGYQLSPTASRTWPLFVEDTTRCEPDVLPVVTPTYSTTAISCTTAGTYTLGEVVPGTISWTVDGVRTAAGTYRVPAAATITIAAVPTKSTDGLDPAWVNPKVLTFTAAAGDCELTTLAFTGASTGGALALAGGMLLLGVGGLVIARRRRAAQH